MLRPVRSKKKMGFICKEVKSHGSTVPETCVSPGLKSKSRVPF
jgi:hypothetical protein